MKWLTYSTLLLLLTGAFVSCKKKKESDPEPEVPTGPAYTIPTTYNFSDANFNEARVRVLLIDDLTTKVKSARGAAVTEQELLDIYNNSANTYSSMANTDLASIADATFDVTLRSYFTKIAALSGASPATGYVDANDSLDLQQLGMKGLWAGLNYKQICTIMNSISTFDNTNPGANYTDAEKKWDEAFAYFGGTIDMNDYSVAQKQAATKERDTDGNTIIDRTKERTFIYAFYAMRIDEETTWGGNFPSNEKFTFSTTIMNQFLKGRAAISNGDNTARNEAAAAILTQLERSLVITILHYLRVHQSYITDPMQQGLTGKRISNWSEALGFVNALAYNSTKVISNTQLATLQSYFGAEPHHMDETDRVAARNLLQSIYNFTSYQFTNL